VTGTIPVAPVTPRAAAATAVASLAAPSPAPGTVAAGRPLRCRALGLRRSLSHGRCLVLVCARHLLVCHLELQSAFAGAVSDGLHATMVTITCPIEDYLADTRGLGLLGQQLSGALGPAHLARPVNLHPFTCVA